jgi:hypothetical protein
LNLKNQKEETKKKTHQNLDEGIVSKMLKFVVKLQRKTREDHSEHVCGIV